jgi:hypothetical protein
VGTFWYVIICLIAGGHWNETWQFYVRRMQFYYLWWITSWKWPSWLKVHRLRRSTKFSKPLCNKFWSWLMRAISSWIAHSTSCVGWGWVLYTQSFKYLHRKNFNTVMSGERTGRGMSPEGEITLWKRQWAMSMLQCDYLCIVLILVSVFIPH